MCYARAQKKLCEKQASEAFQDFLVQIDTIVSVSSLTILYSNRNSQFLISFPAILNFQYRQRSAAFIARMLDENTETTMVKAAVITLSVDGTPGQNSIKDKHGSNGVHAGAHGESGGDATPAKVGTNACSLSVQIQQSQDNGTIHVIDSLSDNTLSVDEDIIISARGGDGGNGADGGNGGNGARGSKGRVRVVS